MTQRLAAVLGAVLAVSTPALGELGHGGLREQLGPLRAPHAMPGVDASRSRHARVRLGPVPHVERRLRIAYGIGRGLVTHEDGGFFVVHPTARASRFDAQGKLIYSLRLPAEAASPPVLTSSGSYALVAGGELQLLDDRGRLRAHTALGDADFTTRSILATRDGGVAVAGTRFIVKLGPRGDLVFRKASPETPLELLELGGLAGLACVTAPGFVYHLDDAGRMQRLGELGGTTSSVTASAVAGLLLARTGSHRLVVFDTREHRPRAAIEDATLELDGPVLLGDAVSPSLQAFTADGLLVRYRGDGSEEQRVPFDPGARKAPGPDDALLLADGRLLVARAGADVAVVTPTGEVSTVPSSACPDPLGLFATGTSAVLLACRSGNVLRLE